MSVFSRFQSGLAEREASDRSFGVLTGVLFGLVALAPLLRGDRVRAWAALAGALLLVLAAIRPAWLHGPKRAWLFLGFLAGLAVHPLVLAILFYGVIVPLGLLMRAAGRDALRLRAQPGPTYWRPRTAPLSNMKDQF